MTLDVGRLATLRQVALRGTMAAAAKALFVTPPAVSQQLHELEKEVGVVLLERVGRRVRLTDAAVRLVEHTEVVLAELDAAEAELQGLASTPAGVVTVGAFPTGASTFLVDAFRDLAESCPKVRVVMVEGNPTQSLLWLRLGEVDMVLGYEYPHVPLGDDEGIDRRELLVDPLVVLVPAGLFPAGSEIGLDELSGRVWAMAPAEVSYGLGVRRACQAAGFEPDVRFQTYDVTVMEAMVAAGLAVAVVPRLALVAHPLPDGVDVEEHRLRGPDLARRVFVATRAGRAPSPAVAATLEAVVAASSIVADSISVAYVNGKD
jgi:DNA-binding transcriptional LysR family regulator